MHEPVVVSSFGRIRCVFWIGLVVAVLLAFSVPGLTLWRSAATALHVQAYIHPAFPRVGQAAHVVLVVTNATDRTDILDSEAQITARWDMLTMTMGVREVALPDPLDRADALSLPLHLDMAGSWWVQVAVHVPSRPVWQTRLEITVQSLTSMNKRAEALAVIPVRVAQEEVSTTADTAKSGHQFDLSGVFHPRPGYAMCQRNQEPSL